MTTSGIFCLLAACLAIALVAMPVTSAAARDLHGAIAFSQSSGAEGFAYDYPSQKAAEARAMAECRKKAGSDCRLATWFRNACGALAVGRGNGFGTTWAPTRYGAETAALSICGKHTAGCKIRRWVCTSHQ